MIRTTCAVTIAAFAMTSAGFAAQGTTSWGRPGVPMAEFCIDSVTCARIGADRDISEEKATDDFVAAERTIDRKLNLPQSEDPDDDFYGTGSVGMVHRRLQPDVRIAELQRTLVASTEGCLRRKGYVPFRLTREQEDRLRRLDRGSEARRGYLHELASDAAVLAAQAAGEEPKRD